MPLVFQGRRRRWLLSSVLGALVWSGRTTAQHTLYYPVEGSLLLKQTSDQAHRFLPTTEVVLNGGEYRTLTRPDGSFLFHDVEPGVYLLDVLSVDYFFSQIKLNLPKTPDSPIQCLEYRYPGAEKRPVDYPLRLVSPMKKQYFEKRETVGLHTLFRNPMLLMVGATGLLVLVMPKLMENMDPEEVKKMNEQMGAAQDPAAFMKHMFGVGADDDDDDDATAQIKDTSSSASSSKKRLQHQR